MLGLSSWSTTLVEDVGATAPSVPKIFQFYFSRSEKVDRSIFKRVEEAGFDAIAITVDTQTLGKREADVKNRFSLPEGLSVANYAQYVDSAAPSTLKSKKESGLSEFVKNYKDGGFTWERLAGVREMTKLPLILKGIQCAEDAVLAVKFGADAIWVSNHGARQLDTTPASIQVLEECVQAVEGKIEVYFDGGVERGTDVLKALALGANAVFLGRPVLWALAYNGQAGVERLLEIMNDELKRAMILTDCLTIKDITRSVIHARYCPRWMDARL